MTAAERTWETTEPRFDRDRGEWVVPDGRPLADLGQGELDALWGWEPFSEAEGLDLPWAAEWTPLSMAIRKAFHVTGRCTRAKLRKGVKQLDQWAADWGLARHGRLVIEHCHKTRLLPNERTGVAALFRIVDLRRFMEKHREANP